MGSSTPIEPFEDCGTEAAADAFSPHSLTKVLPTRNKTTEDESAFPGLDQQDAYQRFRHRGCHGLREITYRTMERAKKPDGFPRCTSTQLRKFAHCGSCCQVARSESTGKYYMTADCCRSRWCPACSHSLRAKVASNLREYIGPRTTRLITLTLKHGTQTIPVLLDRLKVCFHNLTRRESWKAHVTGFGCFFEVKYNDDSTFWHVHAHILYEGEYWKFNELSDEWFSVTGDSYMIDICAVDGPRGIDYAAKYCAKPGSLADVPEELRPVLLSALHGRRLWHCGGTWKKWKLRKNEKLPDDLKPVGSFNNIYWEAQRGCIESAKLLKELTQNPDYVVEVFEPPD